MPQLKSPAFIIVIILFAVTGFTGTFYWLNNSLIANPQPPQYLKLLADDSTEVGVVRVNSISEVPYLDSAQRQAATEHPSYERTPAYMEHDVTFHRNPSLSIWTILILFMMTIASGGFPVFVMQIAELIRKYKYRWPTYVGVAMGMAALFWFLMVLPFQQKGLFNVNHLAADLGVITHDATLFPIIAGVTTILLIPALATIFFVGSAAGSLTAESDTAAEATRLASEYAYLKQILGRSLSMISIIVVFSVLTSGTLNAAFNAVVSFDEGLEIFPVEVTYTYGLFYTLFLVIMYIPVHYYLKFKGTNLEDDLSNTIAQSDDEKWVTDIKTKLELKASGIDNLKMGLTLLAPLISSLLPESLHFLG